jgi:hypothetical protein
MEDIPQPTKHENNEPTKQSRTSDSDRLGIALFCLAIVAALVLFLIDKSSLSISLTLAAILGFLIYPILHFFKKRLPRVAILLVALIGGAFFGYKIWPRIPAKCKVSADGSSDIVARLYFRGIKPPTRDVTYEPQSQELFYEWTLAITSDTDVANAAVTIQEISLDERLRVTPDNPAISSRSKPKWSSGFTEHRNPDSYEGIIQIGPLSRDKKTVVVLRYPLNFKLPTGNEPARLVMPGSGRQFEIATVPPCEIDKTSHDPIAQQELNGGKILALAMQSYKGEGKPPLKIRNSDSTPPPLQKNEVEATLEYRCENVKCERPIVDHLEGRSGPREMGWGSNENQLKDK